MSIEYHDVSSRFDDDEKPSNSVLSALKKLELLGKDLSREMLIAALLDSQLMERAKLQAYEARTLCRTFNIDWDLMRERKNRQITDELPPASQRAIAFFAELYNEVSKGIAARIMESIEKETGDN